MVEADWPQITTRRMRFACRITKATDTHTLGICNTYSFSGSTMVSHTRFNVTFMRTLPHFFSIYVTETYEPAHSRKKRLSHRHVCPSVRGSHCTD
jgi:hypothetical protein